MKTALSTSTVDSITIAGFDLASELMGVVGFSEMTFVMLKGRKPTEPETALLDAVLVALCDHGLTPTAIAARMTLLSAPDSFQGAMAAGILGAGSRFLGVVEDTAAMLQAAVANAALGEPTERTAARVIEEITSGGGRVPGLGHHLHKAGDPRVPRLIEIARTVEREGPHLRLLQAIGAAWNDTHASPLPINGAGACGAVLSDLDMPAQIVRGFAVLARAAGTMAQLAEELRMPMAREMWHEAERSLTYEAGPGPA